MALLKIFPFVESHYDQNEKESLGSSASSVKQEQKVEKKIDIFESLKYAHAQNRLGLVPLDDNHYRTLFI